MGNWGIQALESDQGLDILQDMCVYYKDTSEIILNDILTKYAFFPENNTEIDYIWDLDAIAVSEIYIGFLKNKSIDYEGLKHINSIIADKKDIEFLLQMLYDIRDEKPDNNGVREYVDLWKETEYWQNWKTHLLNLISALENLKYENKF